MRGCIQRKPVANHPFGYTKIVPRLYLGTIPCRPDHLVALKRATPLPPPAPVRHARSAVQLREVPEVPPVAPASAHSRSTVTGLEWTQSERLSCACAFLSLLQVTRALARSSP